MLSSLIFRLRRERTQNRLASVGPREESLELDSHPLLESDTEDKPRSDQNEAGYAESKSRIPPPRPVGASWASLPNKTQVILLLLVKFSELAYRSSTRTYLYSQLKWFDPSLPDSVVSTQAGTIQGFSTAVRVGSAIIVGRLADKASIGRKNMLLLGLFGYAVSSIGLAFSRSFFTAAMFQAAGGLLDGNAGLVRTVLAEIVKEKQYQSRTFTLLAIFANMGGAIGPIIGGVLADPVNSYPKVFGPGPRGWMTKWPYALPSLASALLCLLVMVMLSLGLDETSEAARHRTDLGRRAGKLIAHGLCSPRTRYSYRPLGENEMIDRGQDDVARSEVGLNDASASSRSSTSHESSGIRFLLVPTVLTLISRFLFNLHDVTYNTLSLVFFPAPRASLLIHQGIHFGGGLGLTTSQVGIAMSISGFITIPLSLLVYPNISNRLGILRSYLIFLPIALLLYAVTPFLVFVPDRDLPLWISIGGLMCLKAISRTFTCPASSIILNNCVLDPSVRGTVNGVGSSITNAATSIGPAVGGWVLGLGFKYNLVGAAWWGLVVVGLVQWCILWRLRHSVTI